jgi:hypothetical protein
MEFALQMVIKKFVVYVPENCFISIYGFVEKCFGDRFFISGLQILILGRSGL